MVYRQKSDSEAESEDDDDDDRRLGSEAGLVTSSNRTTRTVV